VDLPAVWFVAIVWALVILALIGHGVEFEYRGKVDDPRWRAR
jgi:cytochrome d ubiquinol oxidase subunit II